jgi:hypothetical protein
MQVGAAQKEVREGTIGDDQAVARHADAPLDREEAVAQHAPLSTPRPRPEPHDHLVSWSRERRASVGRSVGGESGIRKMDWACSVQHRRKVRYLLIPAVCKVISKRERWHTAIGSQLFFDKCSLISTSPATNIKFARVRLCSVQRAVFPCTLPAALDSTSVTSAEKLTG